MKRFSALALSHLLFILLLLLFGGTESYEASHHNITNDILCSSPYYPVGNFCLMIEHEEKGNQTHMQRFCEDLDGVLVNIKDANMLYDIFTYTRDHGLADVSYWIGAQSERDEWKWSSDGSDVRMGPPLWGNNQPDGKPDQEHCAIIKASDYYYINDNSCYSHNYGGICQPKDVLSEPVLSQLSEECPPPFKMIGTGCFLVQMLEIYDCDEAVAFCQNDHNSHLARIDDANIIGELYDLLLDEDASFWIDGNDIVQEDNWIWRDGSPVKRGTPFWAVNYRGEQDPDGDIVENCLSLLFDNYYHFDDSFESDQLGALCQIDL